MNTVSNVFGVLASAGFGSAAGALVTGLLYALMGSTDLLGMSVLVVGPGLVIGFIGCAGVRWGIHRDQSRFLARLAERPGPGADLAAAFRR